jgi:hypothetical protein
MLITDRAAIAAMETLSWNAVDKVFDPLAANPADWLSPSFSVTTDRGLQVSVDHAPVTASANRP